MKRFRNKVTLLFCIVFFLLSMLILVTFLLAYYIDLYRSEQKELQHIGEKLQMHLAKSLHFAGVDKAWLLDAHIQEINGRISFLFDQDDLNIGYAIYFKDGRLAYEYQQTEHNLFATQADRHGRPFFLKMRTYKDWHFYQWISMDKYNVLIASSHHLEAVDKMLWGFAILIPVVLLLAFFLGHAMSRKIVTPLHSIAVTARKIEQGDLRARIPSLSSGDEIDELISTLNGTFEELERAFARIKRFSCDVAHELRTPLTALRGNMEVSLRRIRSPREYQITIADGIQEIASLTKLIDSLLLLGQDAASALKQTEEVELHALLEDIIDQLRILADERRIRLEFEPDGHELYVRCVKVLLARMSYNLIHNALQFSPPGSTVKVVILHTSGAATISVRDQGIGMSQNTLQRIFDRLFQADQSRSKGFGLGLSIVKWIVDLHKWKISVTSTEKIGSVFQVTLPVI